VTSEIEKIKKILCKGCGENGRHFTKIGRVDYTPWLCGSPPQTGQKQQYPGRFLHNLQKWYPWEGKKVLSMFSGATDIGTTTDIREETGADYVCPFDKIPLPDGSFDMILADPPYTTGFGFEWTKHMKDIPKPKHILGEAARLVKVGGLILILHIQMIPAYKVFKVKRVGMHPIFCGTNNVIRLLNVFEKHE
jgi:hypothetical protein